jgi:NAD(P)-dependent dehydrogenase (short-subunit alcohol dehydrogenase family)
MKKIAFISGVGGGIGRATARVFFESGWNVIGVDRKKSASKPHGVNRFICADIADPSTNEKIFEEVFRREGRLDALINNAAIQIVKPLLQTMPEEWDETMAINVRGAYLSIKHAYPLLRQRGGSIINVSSVHALATSAGVAAYAASKGAMTALTRVASIELATDHIRVNAVLPGAVDTEMLRAGLLRNHIDGDNINERLESLGQKHLLGRIGRPEEIGKAILFLADDKMSSFITGHSFVVDGGATVHLSTE